MVSVKEQYETFPYPERDPEDEKTRLITGSPSHPLEMDHRIGDLADGCHEGLLACGCRTRVDRHYSVTAWC